MRRPRVRFTMGTLLVAVALVAANFWCFRPHFETDLYRSGESTYRILPLAVGILPLFNAALMAAWVAATRTIRSRRRRDGHSPSSPPGFAYLSLHFLGLLVLVGLFLPDVAPSVEDRISPVIARAAEKWGSAFGDPNGAVPWLVLQSAILGVVVSGPALLLSGIGDWIARYGAAILPRRRFAAIVAAVEFGFAGAALAIGLSFHTFEEEQDVVFHFRVVDHDSGRPIRAAFVGLTDPFSCEPDTTDSRAFTDDGGRARLIGRFTIQGERNAFRTLGDFSPWGRWLEVAAPGYRTRRIPLIEVLGPTADPTRVAAGKIVLEAGHVRSDSFRDIAGTYSWGYGFGGATFQIEPDGRFAWTASSCTSFHREYGYLKRRSGQIAIVPIRCPGQDLSPPMTLMYRAIAWGDCVVLCSTNERDLRSLCRSALDGDRRRAARRSVPAGIYVRESEIERPLAGLPQISLRSWLAYLASEVRLGDDESRLRQFLGPLVRVEDADEDEPTVAEDF